MIPIPKSDNCSLDGPTEKIKIKIDIKKNDILVKISWKPLR